MTIDFAVGRTNPEDFPVEAFKAAAARAIDNEFEALTNYHIGLGHPRLREILAARESDREGVTVDPDHLALMNGSMQGVTLVAETLIEHAEDHVLVEDQGFAREAVQMGRRVPEVAAVAQVIGARGVERHQHQVRQRRCTAQAGTGTQDQEECQGTHRCRGAGSGHGHAVSRGAVRVRGSVVRR